MQIAKIEQEFIKKRNRLASAVGFLGIGIGALAATKGLGALPLCFVAIPLAIDVLTLNSFNKDKKKSAKGLTLYQPFFQISMKKWINKYIKKSENIHEKKYKYMFLSAWLEYKKLSFNQVGFSDISIFRVLEEELKTGNIPLNQIRILSNHHILGSNGYNKFNEILEEDKNFPERIKIAKEVYKEYSNYGIAGRAFVDDKEFNIFAFLQDYKFTEKDYEIIDKEPAHIHEHPLFIKSIEEYPESTIRALNTIVENEDRLNKLNILKFFCEKRLAQADDLDNVISIENFKIKIEKKIEYIELGNELEEIKEVPKKRNKTKI